MFVGELDPGHERRLPNTYVVPISKSFINEEKK